MILGCTCSHKYQDEKYGKGKRVHNPKKKTADGTTRYCCTVCTKVNDKQKG